MKTPILIGILLALLVSCTQKSTVPTEEADMKNLMESLVFYLEGVTTGDMDQFMSVWADDAVRMEEGINMIQGKDDIREHFRPYLEELDTRITHYGERKIEISGDLAYGHSNFIVSVNPKGMPDSVTHTDFKYLEVYKRQPDGSWKIQAACATTNPVWTGDISLEDILKEEDRSVPRL